MPHRRMRDVRVFQQSSFRFAFVVVSNMLFFSVAFGSVHPLVASMFGVACWLRTSFVACGLDDGLLAAVMVRQFLGGIARATRRGIGFLRDVPFMIALPMPLLLMGSALLVSTGFVGLCPVWKLEWLAGRHLWSSQAFF